MAQFSEQMKAMLGIDVTELLKKTIEQNSDAPKLADADKTNKKTDKNALKKG